MKLRSGIYVKEADGSCNKYELTPRKPKAKPKQSTPRTPRTPKTKKNRNDAISKNVAPMQANSLPECRVVLKKWSSEELKAKIYGGRRNVSLPNVSIMNSANRSEIDPTISLSSYIRINSYEASMLSAESNGMLRIMQNVASEPIDVGHVQGESTLAQLFAVGSQSKFKWHASLNFENDLHVRNFEIDSMVDLFHLHVIQNIDWKAIAKILARDFGTVSTVCSVNMHQAVAVSFVDLIKNIDWKVIAKMLALLADLVAFHSNIGIAEVEEITADEEGVVCESTELDRYFEAVSTQSLVNLYQFDPVFDWNIDWERLTEAIATVSGRVSLNDNSDIAEGDDVNDGEEDSDAQTTVYDASDEVSLS